MQFQGISLMKKEKLITSRPNYFYKIEKLDLSAFSGIEDVEALSEDGLKKLLSLVDLWVGAGWRFVDCFRDDANGALYYVHFEKGTRKET
jgi:hypothetical protein